MKYTWEEDQVKQAEMGGKAYTYEKPLIAAGKATKYSDQIFSVLYREAREHVKRYGNERFQFSRLQPNDDSPVVSIRALKGLQGTIN